MYLQATNILIFDINSSPCSNSNEGSLSNILIRVIDEPFSNMSFYVKLDDYFNMQFISDNEVHIIGNGIIPAAMEMMDKFEQHLLK